MNKTFIKITHTEYLNDSISEFGTLLNFDDTYNFLNKVDHQTTKSFGYFYKSGTNVDIEFKNILQLQ